MENLGKWRYLEIKIIFYIKNIYIKNFLLKLT